MADDTEKSGEITLQQAAGRDADVREPAATDIHFGDLDIDNVYVLPTAETDAPSTFGAEFMLGEEGQELSDPSRNLSPQAISEQTISAEVGEFMDGLSIEGDVEVMFDVTSTSIPVLHNPSLPHTEFQDLVLEGPRQLVDLDQLFDTVGATGQQNPFGDAPDHQVSLEDTFWDPASQEQVATAMPELFDPIVTVDPSQALDNVFETLYVADES